MIGNDSMQLAMLPMEVREYQSAWPLHWQYHGTSTGYSYGCRCGRCKEANAASKRSTRSKAGHSRICDHDHRCCPGHLSCGRCLRGLLCQNCNAGLGFLGDDPERVKSLLAYLEPYGAGWSLSTRSARTPSVNNPIQENDHG